MYLCIHQSVIVSGKDRQKQEMLKQQQQLVLSAVRSI